MSLANLHQSLTDRGKPDGVVCVLLSMHRSKHVGCRLKFEPPQNRTLRLRNRRIVQRNIEHDISSSLHRQTRDSLCSEVPRGLLGRRKQQRRYMIRQNSVDLLRHSHIERSKSRLHMCNWNMKLGGCEGASKCRISIPQHDDPIGHLVKQQILQCSEHRTSLLAV